MKETIEEVALRLYPDKGYEDELYCDIGEYNRELFIEGAKWQAEKSQKIVPSDAYNIEVFAIKPDENGQLFAYIGYKISNGNFEFNVVPFTEPQERMYSEEDMKLAFDAGHKKGFSGYPNTENWKELPFNEWFEQFKKENKQ